MHGINVLDQCRGYYTCALESHKCWHRLLTFILESSMQNSFVMYKEDSETLGLPKHLRQLWLFMLDKQLVVPCVCPNIPRWRFSTLARRGFYYKKRHKCLRCRCVVCRARLGSSALVVVVGSCAVVLVTSKFILSLSLQPRQFVHDAPVHVPC